MSMEELTSLEMLHHVSIMPEYDKFLARFPMVGRDVAIMSDALEAFGTMLDDVMLCDFDSAFDYEIILHGETVALIFPDAITNIHITKRVNPLETTDSYHVTISLVYDTPGPDRVRWGLNNYVERYVCFTTEELLPRIKQLKDNIHGW